MTSAPSAAGLTHTTALVIVPPGSCWPPIQTLRERYDPKVRRWMPHVTPVSRRRPWELAQEVSTVDRASNGRGDPGRR